MSLNSPGPKPGSTRSLVQAPITGVWRSPEYEGSGYICNPYYYFCGFYPVSSSLGVEAGIRLHAGGGVGFKLGEGPSSSSRAATTWPDRS
jgi:hypothetical protein